MKNIFATIEYVAEKILEAITGHKNDKQAHPNLSEQINVLLQRNHLPAKDNRGVVTKPSDYKSQFTFAGLKSEGVTGLPTWSHVFGVNAYSGIDGFTNVYEYAFCNGEMYIRNQYPLNEDTWGEWQQLATTSKTDISLLNGWVAGFPDQYAMHLVKTGNMVNIIACITGGVGSVSTGIATIPVEFRPKKTILGYADVIGGGYDNSRFLIIPNGTIQTNTEWDSSLIYQISFTYSIE